MKDEGYINIQGWMINKLKLQGNELILYAIIYGFSQDGNSKYRGSLSYIENALGITRKSVILNLKKLIDKKYIKREKNNTGNLYSVESTPLRFKVVEKVHQSSVESTLVSSVESTPNNNKYINKYNNKDLPEWLNQESWNNWLNYRKERGKSLTASTIPLQIKKLEKWKKDHVAIIEQSITEGWVGLFELKKDYKKANNTIVPDSNKYAKYGS